ncbi:MAG: carbohydrate binding family 9 domain-containing protein [Flavobacteriales bacterium]|nr:carbohydrate binding family 9 domain-containing protein [Flavobacteriales bacterium]
MRTIGLFILMLVVVPSMAQEVTKLQLNIKKAAGKIELDGVLDEADWLNAHVAKDFYQNFPADTSFALTKTEVRITFDDQNIYIGAVCFDELDGEYIIQSLKRDFSYSISDAFAVYIDPFNDKQNGFSFAVNPLGVQREGLLQDGGGFGVTTSWDNKWFVKVTRHSDKWIVEMAIPFKTIRFSAEQAIWGINFGRNDLKRNESSTWSPVPRNFNVASLSHTGDLIWKTKPNKTGSNVALIPYAIGGVYSDYSTDTSFYNGNVGLDAKIAITSSLNLDLTVNPDFSQVDVDQQVTNLSRFSLFFPERRNFFIENSDLFSRFGFRQIRPFFSRRIGLNNGTPVPIIAGARLSGKINRDWRIGIMNMQTEGVGEIDLGGQNYTVAAIQRRVGIRSNIAGIVVNRQGFNGKTMDFSDYNRILGLDFNLSSADNKWRGKAFYHHSFTPNTTTNSFAHAVWTMYNSEKIQIHYNHEIVTAGYNAEVGFVPRVSNYNPETDEFEARTYWRFEPSFQYKFYPKSDKINQHGPTFSWSEYLSEDLKTTERESKFSYELKFKNQSRIEVTAYNRRVLLYFDTDVTFNDNPPIAAGDYEFANVKLEYQSTKLKIFNYELTADYGQYYIGSKFSFKAAISFRKQPWGIFSISFNQNEIYMPEGYENASLTLIGPKIELSFTKELFFTTFIQYNTQAENMNINARLQYRFRPMSDLFIVYTDNYLPYNFSIKNRALVVKFVYWLSL